MSYPTRPQLLRHPLAREFAQQLLVIILLTGAVSLGLVLVFNQRLLPTVIYTGCITVIAWRRLLLCRPEAVKPVIQLPSSMPLL